MLSDGVILLHDNTHTASKTQELLQKFKWIVWNHPPYNPDLAPNLGSKHFSGTSFSSYSDVKTSVSNWLNGQGRDFYQVGQGIKRPLADVVRKFGEEVLAQMSSLSSDRGSDYKVGPKIALMLLQNGALT
ncbi:hypothetical protein AVEN_161300-1 [Araneus ventricosus]|uniref:Histone-lysine N-methyltransferase SETMAR n=1 Tax=Araneus ventricosus TaxID=182803 RepID=A0A4Y2DRF6_ARAVE|nr:hypothetical protein AVEN_161300-1 [Araneus ventricosus]